jgi:WhiB family transcriptional regulator, redox-sensing transcriptional regulator
MQDLSWRDQAACRRTDPGLWYPSFNAREVSPLERRRVSDAKAVCAGCPVREQCLVYAMDCTIWTGIWGGLTERERRNLAHNTRRAAKCKEKVP